MRNIAVIGSGKVGTALATKLASAGYNVTMGARSVEEAIAKWKGPALPFKGLNEAVQTADVIINAMPGASSLETLTNLREALQDKVLIDVTNATRRGADGSPGTLLYPGSSLAEKLQEALPETAVVKTLNTMLFTVMTRPELLQQQPTVFLSGNSEEAKATVATLLHDLGWEVPSIEDLGDISTAQGPEAFVLLVPHIVRKHGFSPFALTISR